MKKIATLGLIAFFAISCKPTMDTKSQVGLKGNWTVTQVSHVGGEFVKIQAFNIGDAKCFEGSQWKFVSNNNSGVIALSGGGGCPVFENNIKWTVSPTGDFNFKFIDEGVKAKHVTSGYTLKVRNQSENAFQLVDKVYTGGQSYDVVYQFNRN